VYFNIHVAVKTKPLTTKLLSQCLNTLVWFIKE